MPTRKKALEGIKVADFSWVVVGPFSTSYLGDFGATVVKVESHTKPDAGRVFGPYKDFLPSVDTSGWFTHQNSSKYSMTLDLTKPKATEVALKLMAWADIVVESMTPGSMERLGLSYEEAKKVNPEIIYLSTCLNGQDGPHRMVAGFGQMACALSGIYDMSGSGDRGPAPPEGAYVDFITPRFIITAVMAALDYRRRTGEGQFIDMSQVETAIHFGAPAIMEYAANKRLWPRQGNRSSCAAPHGAFPCQGEDRWIAIGVHDDEEWNGLCRVMGNPSWATFPEFATFEARKANEDELERRISEWTCNSPAEDLVEQLQAAGVPSSIVESNKDLFEDQQLEHRGHFRLLNHTVMGQYYHDSRAFRMSKTPDTQFSAPALGEHNELVYREFLGYSDDEIADLYAERVITTEADLPI